ncbi:PorT protein [Flavobacterium akiainvivens]|uniref:PorT protein n=1 Tax=Flavobacterium akiainvivens TaxID=1202724 RepID=A0A0M8MJX5_9FLAO|nr:porin family protein [Flavobacterium akiainvivens]KOS07731.1 PorT protein [Flavobacterium akiainvivens]SFQ25199.1 probable protein-translocating porin PorT [Flavobacterium akiainvivens]
MKKFLLYIFLLSGLLGRAQFGTDVFSKHPIINMENFDKQRVHWGYFLGFNSYDFKFDYKVNPGVDIIAKKTTGFNVGLVGNLRLMENLDLRLEPGLYYTQRNLTYNDPRLLTDFEKLREVKSTYIHFPLLLKFSAKRTGNVRPYLLGGVSRTWNLDSNADAKDDNLTGDRFRMKKWTSNYELGFGVDLYFEYFKFSPSIRGVFGLEDELIRDNTIDSPYTGNIESMKTRAIFINFTFH